MTMRLQLQTMPFGFSTGPYAFHKLSKRESPQEAVCMGIIVASVSLKLFISGNERCHTTDAP